MKRLYFLSLILIPFLSISQDITSGLVGYWPFNGNANDESGNGNHGVVYGATLTEDRFGNANSAYSFDGVDDFINVNNDPSLQITSEFSICAWIKRDVLDNSYREIVRKGGTAGGYFLLINKTNELAIGIGGSLYTNGYLLSGIGQWEHVAGVYSDVKDSVYLFLNGQLVHAFYTNTILQANTHPLRIGSTENSSQIFSGAIDDVLIYNRALSHQEIQEIYSDQVPLPLPPSLVVCQSLYCDGENIGIGTPHTHGYKLAVAGDILTEKIKVATQANWPDYVFSPEYEMPSLEELEQYIRQNQKLPGIPSATEAETDGIDLGEMNRLLLEKVEMLTMYMIELNQRIENQITRINNIEKENLDLKAELEILRKN